MKRGNERRCLPVVFSPHSYLASYLLRLKERRGSPPILSRIFTRVMRLFSLIPRVILFSFIHETLVSSVFILSTHSERPTILVGSDLKIQRYCNRYIYRVSVYFEGGRFWTLFRCLENVAESLGDCDGTFVTYF